MKFFLAPLFLFAAMATPAVAQDKPEPLETSVSRAKLLMQTCDILFQNIATFDQSINGCTKQRQDLKKYASTDTPEQRGIVLIASTHIDANIAAMYLLRKEPDLPFGCAVVNRALKRFAEYPEPFSDVDGLGAIATKAQGRLSGASSKCGYDSFTKHQSIMDGTHGIKMLQARGCFRYKPEESAELVKTCAADLTKLTEVFQSKAEPLPLDFNEYLIHSMGITKVMYRAAENEGKFADVVCKSLPTFAPLADAFVHPMSSQAAYTAEKTKETFGEYAKRCAALE